MDAQLLQDQIAGLKQRLVQLKATERIMLQAHALEAQIGIAKKELNGYQAEIEPLKVELADLQEKRGGIVNAAMVEFSGRMEKALPEGQPAISVNDNSMEIGWMIDGKSRPYRALSGGEKVSFDVALAHAMNADIIIKESAELDSKRLEMTLRVLRELPEQIVIVSCHKPETIPEGWTVCQL
jgi:DNA repair exonuclease SbcCD ATPase subunit